MTVKEQVLDLHARFPNMTAPEMVEIIGCARGQVYQVKAACGLNIPLVTHRKTEIIDLHYADTSLTCTQIAERVGCRVAYVRELRRDLALPIPREPRKIAPRPARQVPVPSLDRILAESFKSVIGRDPLPEARAA